MVGYFVVMALVASAVIFIMKNNQKQQQPEQLQQTKQPEIITDAVIDVNGTEVPVSFHGLNVKFVQLPFRKELYGMDDELYVAASLAAEDYSYGCAVVVYDIGGGDTVGIMIRWQPLYGFASTIETTFRKGVENKIQQALDKVMPYKG